MVAALINAGSLAFLRESSLPLIGVIVAVSVAVVQKSSSRVLLVDPEDTELETLSAGGTFAFITSQAQSEDNQMDTDVAALSTARIVWSSWEGEFALEEFAEAERLARQAAFHILQTFRETLFGEEVDSNARMPIATAERTNVVTIAAPGRLRHAAQTFSTTVRKSMLEFALLWLFHLFLALKRFFATLLPVKSPRPLRARRKKLPNHLAVLLSSEGNSGNNVTDGPEAIESVRRLAEWCRITGIEVLSVFDSAGTLLEAYERVQQVLEADAVIESVSICQDTGREYELKPTTVKESSRMKLPPTPPLSTTASWSSIRSASPDLYLQMRRQEFGGTGVPYLVTFKLRDSRVEEGVRRRQSPLNPQSPSLTPGPLTIYLLSTDLGKPQLARVTRDLAHSAVEGKPQSGDVSWKSAVTPTSLSLRLEDPTRHAGWPCPDLLLIHTSGSSRKAQLSPLEFEGFPPWQIHLTEITYIPPRRPQTDFLRRFWPLPTDFPGSISETSFRIALDEYDGAEMRFGK
ncbi:hypothetical protein FRC17_007825 [Serendipita sp. 399]|nr:hypothetical protein FRC17_007825 [Serendipita sp. 399]